MEIASFEFCPISSDCGKLEIPYLERIFLIKYFGMLENGRITAFMVFELLME